MAKVFVSYSRKDIEFARRLTGELQKSDLDFWIDWEGIPPTVDWWKEIEKGIEEADAFLFLISPDSVKSKVCGQEIECAAKNGKRLIPLVVRDVKGDEVPSQLGHLNWIFFRENDDFDASVQKLLTSIHTDYEWVQQHRWLQVRALDWERDNKDPSSLLRGQDLQEAEFQLATNSSKEPYPTDLQREFVFASRKATDRQRRIITGISITGAIVLAALALFGLYQAKVATEKATIARADELAAQSVSERNDQFDLSLLLSVEAFRRANTFQTRSTLLDNTQSFPQLLQLLHVDTGKIFSLNFSLDDKSLVSFSCAKESNPTSCPTNEIILWDMETQQSISEPLPGYGDEISYAAIRPDGEVLALAINDNTIILWDMENHQPIGRPLPLSDNIYSLSFSPDGKTLASASGSVFLPTSGSIILWDLTREQRIGQPIKMDFIPNSIAFSSDGKTLAIAGPESIILWDVGEGHLVGQPIQIFNDVINGLAFSPDNTTLASASDRSIILWEIGMGLKIGELPEETGNFAYRSIAFSRDGRILASGSCERVDVVLCVHGKIALWDLTGRWTIRQSISIGTGFAFNPDGKTIAAPSDDHSIVLWDIGNHQILGKPLQVLTDSVNNVAFAPDGKILASTGNSTVLWDLASRQMVGQPIRDLRGHVIFSPDGKKLALEGRASDGSDTVVLWNIETGRPTGQPIKPSEGDLHYAITFAFSPDSKTLAIGSMGSKDIVFIDAGTGRPTRPPLEEPGGSVTGLVFSPDGKTLVSASESINFWNVATGQLIGQSLSGHTFGVLSLDFSPDGKMLASGSCRSASLGFCLEGEIILWDAATRQPIGNPLMVNGDVDRVVFSPDGSILATEGGGIILWEMNPNAWAKSNCQRAGRNFTTMEWAKYFPGEDYHITCPQWPAGQ